jgi:TusE/DsrC/DsvC family sulfur relay protein
MTARRPGFERTHADAYVSPGWTNAETLTMDAYVLDSRTYEHDEEGYLKNLSDWNKELAELIAKEENIELTPEHWEVINFLREYYEEYQVAPAIRVLVKAMKKAFGPEKGDQKYLYQLFPYGPAKQACKIAGLPKPTGCV